MTEAVNLGKEWEDERMQIQDKAVNQGPMEHDEGWWEAVLADEPVEEEDLWSDELLLPIESGNKFLNQPDTELKINWEKVKNLFNNDEIIELTVVGHNRGGILVAGEDIHGFVPASHLVDLPAEIQDSEKEQHFFHYMDRDIALKVIECDREKDRIVFSERAALAEEGKRKYLLNNLREGDLVEGVVTNVTDFGAFVDLGGLEGLIHISELSWGRVNHPSEILSVNEKISVLVIQVSEDEGRIALSLKQLQKNPWEKLDEKYAPGDILEATICSIVKYGTFAKISCGVEGLIHISTMNFPEGCSQIDDFLYEGQRVLVKILSIDTEKRRLGLQLERCLENND